MTTTNKIIASGIVGAALLGGYGLMGGNDSSKSSYVRTDNPTQTRTTISTGERDRDCADFSTQREAQKFFEANGGPANDPHNLDRDSDGKVCESLK